MSWKIGDKAVRVSNLNYPSEPGYENESIPKIGQVVTVNYTEVDRGHVYLGFEEMPAGICYTEYEYRKLSDYGNELSEEILNEVLIEEPVEV